MNRILICKYILIIIIFTLTGCLPSNNYPSARNIDRACQKEYSSSKKYNNIRKKQKKELLEYPNTYGFSEKYYGTDIRYYCLKLIDDSIGLQNIDTLYLREHIMYRGVSNIIIWNNNIDLAISNIYKYIDSNGCLYYKTKVLTDSIINNNLSLYDFGNIYEINNRRVIERWDTNEFIELNKQILFGGGTNNIFRVIIKENRFIIENFRLNDHMLNYYKEIDLFNSIQDSIFLEKLYK